ncbi:MAG: hypothetical protein ACW97Z_05045 [Candidatus Hodarchaeales archaeon]
MTTLDTFLAYLPEDVNLLAGHQQTPDTIFLSYTEEDFFKILNHSIADRLIFRFLEEKNSKNLLIHLYFTYSYGNILLSINVTNRTSEFSQQLVDVFPSAAFYLNSMN